MKKITGESIINLIKRNTVIFAILFILFGGGLVTSVFNLGFKFGQYLFQVINQIKQMYSRLFKSGIRTIMV